MGVHSLDELTLKWRQEQLTADQMIGQLLQHVGVLYDRLRLVERQLSSVVAATESVASGATTASAKGKKA